MTQSPPWIEIWDEEIQAGALGQPEVTEAASPGRRQLGRVGRGPSPPEGGLIQVRHRAEGTTQLSEDGWPCISSPLKPGNIFVCWPPP